MKEDEIKTRLAGYRPEIYDTTDPDVAEALRLARQDPQLSAWLDRQITFDRQFASALKNAPGSTAGIESLLRSAEQERRKPFVRRPKFLLAAAAAALVVGAGLLKYFFFPAPVDFPELAEPAQISDFRDQMAFFANQRFSLDMSTGDLSEASAWLRQRELPIYAVTPASIREFRALGCKQIAWQGGGVSLLCFRNGKGEVVHLFVASSGSLGEEGGLELGRLQRMRGLETLGWRDESKVYLFVGSKPGVSLEGLL